MQHPRRVSVELSLYPLTDDYKKPILNLVRQLQDVVGLEVVLTPMSTQLHGDFGLIWSTLGELLPACFGESYLQVAVIKLVSVDVTD